MALCRSWVRLLPSPVPLLPSALAALASPVAALTCTSAAAAARLAALALHAWRWLPALPTDTQKAQHTATAEPV